MVKTLIFDTETTNLIRNSLIPLAKQPRVIELFYLQFEDQEEVGAVHHLIHPGEKITEEITRITGIKDSDLINKPKWDKISDEVTMAIEMADEVVAHNLSFDKAMIDNEMARTNHKIHWPRLICTVENTEYLQGFRMSLTVLHEYLFGEPFSGAHRAEQDVRALARCFFELRKREIV